jgi:hypothetical protein
MKKKNFLCWCPGSYIYSRLFQRGEWKSRETYFGLRDSWTIENWMACSPGTIPWDLVLLRYVLKQVGDYIGIEWYKLRPSDQFDQELRLPTPRLHHRMMLEMLEEIELALESSLDIPKDAPNANGIVLHSIGDLIERTQMMWRSYKQMFPLPCED